MYIYSFILIYIYIYIYIYILFISICVYLCVYVCKYVYIFYNTGMLMTDMMINKTDSCGLNITTEFMAFFFCNNDHPSAITISSSKTEPTNGSHLYYNFRFCWFVFLLLLNVTIFTVQLLQQLRLTVNGQDWRKRNCKEQLIPADFWNL